MSESDDYDTREQVVQTERGFTLEISHKRGTDVRDQDEVSATWKLESRPRPQACSDLAADVRRTMSDLREANQPEGEDE